MAATLSTIDMANILIETQTAKNTGSQYKERLGKSIDSIALLAHASQEINQARHQNIKPCLSQEAQIIAHTAPLGSKELFGPDVIKRLQNMTASNRALGSRQRGKFSFRNDYGGRRGAHATSFSKNWQAPPKNPTWSQRGAMRGRYNKSKPKLN
eukprot:gene14640-16159_t